MLKKPDDFPLQAARLRGLDFFIDTDAGNCFLHVLRILRYIWNNKFCGIEKDHDLILSPYFFHKTTLLIDHPNLPNYFTDEFLWNEHLKYVNPTPENKLLDTTKNLTQNVFCTREDKQIKKEIKKNKQKKERKKETLCSIPIPPWLSRSSWFDLLNYKKNILRSEVSQLRMLAILRRLHEDGENVSLCIERTIAFGWKGVFPINRKSPLTKKTETASERAWRLGNKK
jgi:hypothetical protein